MPCPVPSRSTVIAFEVVASESMINETAFWFWSIVTPVTADVGVAATDPVNKDSQGIATVPSVLAAVTSGINCVDIV